MKAIKAIKDIVLADVKAVMAAKGYEVFNRNGVPNIVGIRSAIRSAELYDDVCFVWWNENNKETGRSYTITTNPSEHYLQNPLNVQGTAILVPEQYKGCWILGSHGKSKQFALIQQGGQVRVYRDKNKDRVLDYDAKTIDTGFFGINLHHGALSDVPVIGVWSAGCQVWRYNVPHKKLMAEFKRMSEAYNFFKFSYTLLDQADFI